MSEGVGVDALRWRAAAASWAVVCGVAALALGQVSPEPANGQAAQAGLLDRMAPRRPVTYVEDTGFQDSVLYATGEHRSHKTEVRWGLMCGSLTDGWTTADLKRVADAHHAAMADPSSVMVIDTPQAGVGTRGPGFNIVFNMSTTNMPVSAPAAFALAEAYLETKFADPVTLTINVSWSDLGSGIIGQTGSSYRSGVAYTDSRAALIAGQDNNDSIEDFLPSGSTVPVRFDALSATVTNVQNIDWTSAAYRSTVGTTAGSIANMTYNSSFSFDFDPSNGVGGNLSLVDTIVHEVGHSLGFTSAVDGGGTSAINVLDLYRFARVDRAGVGDTNPDNTAEFGTTAREVDFDNPGTEDVISDIVTNEWRMSDGSPYQSSHFYQQSCNAGSATGIMQPALCNGTTFFPEYLKSSDYLMLDAIGWDDTTCPVPFISSPPQGAVVCSGSPLSLSVTAVNGALSYQWRKDTLNIVGATGPTYTVASTSAANSGVYDVIVTNSCGSRTSAQAIVDVSTGPVIHSQPASVVMCATGTVRFSVVVPAVPTPSYQWRKNTVAINGATASTLTLLNVQELDEGSFDCVVTTSCGATTSQPATLTVNQFAGVVTQPVSQTACIGSPVTFTAAASGSITGYQWRKGGSNIAGATSPTLTIASVVANDAGEYDCLVGGPCGNNNTDPAYLTVTPAVGFTAQPASQLACEGSAVTLSVGVSGAASVQWRRNGIDVPGATGVSLLIGSLDASTAGTYDVVATSGCGVLTSNPATVSLQTVPQLTTPPANASSCNGQPFSFSVGATGAQSYQWRRNGVGLSGATGPSYSGVVTANDAGTYDCVLTNACGGVTSNAAVLTVGTGPVFTTMPGDVVADEGAAVSLNVVASGTAPVAYQWRRDGSAITDSAQVSGTATPTLTLSALSQQLVGSYDVIVTDACGSGTSDAAAVSIDSSCPADLDDGSGSGNPDGGVDINDLLYFLGAFEAGGVVADLDNGSLTGTPDGGVDINDLLYFLVRFEAGC